LPVLAFGVYQVVRAGTLDGLLYWTLWFNATGEYRSMAAQHPTLIEIGAIVSAFLLIPAAVLNLADSKKKGDRAWQDFAVVLLLLGTGCISAYPRFGFFHLQPTLPMAALASSLTLAHARRSVSGGRLFAKGVAIALAGLWCITAARSYRPVFHVDSKPTVWEYSDLVPLAKEILSRTGSMERVYVFPEFENASNLYYLLRCPPPEFWMIHYPWYLVRGIQNRILSALNHSPPEWIVRFPDAWNAVSRVPEIDRYLQDHYRPEAALPWTTGDVVLLKRLETPVPR
jgi:hypothetical protein